MFLYIRESIAMGIHGFGQVNISSLQKLLASRNNGAGSYSVQTNINLTRNGSIFNMPRVTRSNNGEKENTATTQSNNTYSVDSGKQAASNANSQAKELKAQTRQTEQNTQLVRQFSSDSKEVSQSTASGVKTMTQVMKNNQRKVEQNNVELQKAADDLQKELTRMDSISNEIETLSASSDTLSSGNTAKITALQTQLGVHSGKLSKYTGKIRTLTRANTMSIRTMNRTSKSYQRLLAKTQKTTEAQQSTADKVMNVANKVGEIAQYTSMAGQGVQVIGKGMRAAGQLMMGTVWGAAAGAALVAASVPVESTGVAVETVGNFGSTAASITKSACCVANGDIQGALTNLQSAAMTVTAAVKGTQQMASGFENIKNSANQAMQQGLANNAANSQVKNMTDGMSRKEIKNEFNMTKKEMKQAAQNGTLDSIKNNTKDMDYKAMRKAAFGDSKTDLISDAQAHASKSIPNKQTSALSAKISAQPSKGAKGGKSATGVKKQFTNKQLENTVNAFKKLGQGLQASGSIVSQLEQLEALNKANHKKTESSLELSREDQARIENLIARARRH